MQLMTGQAAVRGTVAPAGTLLVKHMGDWRSAALPWKVAGAKVSVADAAFTADNVPHLGHGRFTLVYDVLRRYLE